MNNQHQAITGYRELTQNDINLMNEIKAYISQGALLLDKVTAHVNTQFDATRSFLSLEEEQKLINTLPKEQRDIPSGLVQTPEAKAEWLRLVHAEPHRWISMAKTNLQLANMELVRAVAQPTNF